MKILNSIDNGTYKKGAIPPYWDGKATDRILSVCTHLLLQPQHV